MLYLWLPIEMFIYINSQVLYVIFLFNTSDIYLWMTDRRSEKFEDL